jgi:hypothetical protein
VCNLCDYQLISPALYAVVSAIGYLKIGLDSTCPESMASGSKAERKAALDAGAWMFNVVTSVGIIMVNKALMAKHGFSFGKASL